ncbi:MAG: riboflavin biosynthesis protein RibF [Bacteroidales bacterium]|nr:riboflavin biosynthesis protein RibF [Bacteroidales bacterium]
MAIAVATGFFDGVHRGHRQVIRTLVQTAHGRGDESLVLTFWPHPRVLLQKDAASLRLLTSQAEKVAMLKSLGVDRVEVLEFTREFAALDTRSYLSSVVRDGFGADTIVLGYDNSIGSDMLPPEQSAAIARSLGMDVLVVPPCLDSGEFPVSSTRIRAALSDGRVDEASGMLGWDYSLGGVVVSGNRIGRTIGFPTANMQLSEPRLQVPANGVYLVRVALGGRTFYGMTNIGVRPTVGKGGGLTIETNIFDFDEDIYGMDLQVCFLRRMREEIHFSSLQELAAQLDEDKKACRLLLGEI